MPHRCLHLVEERYSCVLRLSILEEFGPPVHHTTAATSTSSSTPASTILSTGTVSVGTIGVSSTESTSASPAGTSEIVTPSPYGDCRNNPTIDCRMYNFNMTCEIDGMYYPWAKKNCPLYCGYCLVPTQSVECKDKLPTCAEYQSDLCTNRLFRLFREENCRKFCKICEGIDYVVSPFVVG
ncbi:uncharacterized protein LOC133181406 [Saccostrea echinata]|uniref:uncharacterized protein LOC133181406 n=1 Tax=Saccostrea echinata TaxID=191078 RepID=UPI002A827043|nr:uncharacterized protein LOC133181406 [Saccostrea echinata]